VNFISVELESESLNKSCSYGGLRRSKYKKLIQEIIENGLSE
jgi:hypothetical protein